MIHIVYTCKCHILQTCAATQETSSNVVTIQGLFLTNTVLGIYFNTMDNSIMTVGKEKINLFLIDIHIYNLRFKTIITLCLFGCTNKKPLPEIYLSIIVRNKVLMSLASF